MDIKVDLYHFKLRNQYLKLN